MQRDLASPELWQASAARARRGRDSLRRRRRMRRVSVPLVMAATATSVGAPAYAAGAKHQSQARSGARHHQHRILRPGDVGPDVVRLQRGLGVAADGVFGRRTDRAVRRFQRRHGLLVDGEVGPRTRAALAAAGHGALDGLVLRLHDRGPSVAALQRALAIPADGQFGPVTVRAVRHYQRAHHLLVDGQAGPHTLGALGLRLHGGVVHAGHQDGSGHHRHGQRPHSLGERAARTARGYLGVAYVWGGETPSGFDCSGLVEYVYARLGVRLPRVTYEQWHAGRHVSPRDLRPGDLVFFHAIGHVGIYLGGGRFIHAPHTGTVVQIDSLSGWYASEYDGAVRVG